jgi:hypothetical protein
LRELFTCCCMSLVLTAAIQLEAAKQQRIRSQLSAATWQGVRRLLRCGVVSPNHQPSASAISHQPSAISHQPSAISCQPDLMRSFALAWKAVLDFECGWALINALLQFRLPSGTSASCTPIHVSSARRHVSSASWQSVPAVARYFWQLYSDPCFKCQAPCVKHHVSSARRHVSGLPVCKAPSTLLGRRLIDSANVE